MHGSVISVVNLSNVIWPISANYGGQSVMMKGEEMTHSWSRWPVTSQWWYFPSWQCYFSYDFSVSVSVAAIVNEIEVDA